MTSQQEGSTSIASSLSSNSNYYKHPMKENQTFEYDQIEHHHRNNSNSQAYSIFGQPLQYVGKLLLYDASTNKLREDFPPMLGIMISPRHAIVQYSSMMSTLSSRDCNGIDCLRFTLNNTNSLSSKVLNIHSVRSSTPYLSVCYYILELELPIGQSSGYAGVITPGMQYYTSKTNRNDSNNHTISQNILSKLVQTNCNNNMNNNNNSHNSSLEYSILDMDAHRIVLHANTSMNNTPNNNNIYLQQSLVSDSITPSASTTPSSRQLNNPSFSLQSHVPLISSPQELQGWYFLNDESVGLQLLGYANERGVIQLIPVTEIYALMHPSEENQETEQETNNMAESRSVEVKEVNRNDSHHLNNGTQQGSCLHEVYAILRVNHDKFITSESDGCIRLWENNNSNNTIDNSIQSSPEQLLSLLHLGSSKSCRNLCMSEDCKFIYGIAGMEVFSIKWNQLNRGHTNTGELEIDTILCLGLQKEQTEQQQQLLSLCALHNGSQLAAGDALGNIYILDTTPILQIKQTIRVPLGKQPNEKKGENQMQIQSSSANPLSLGPSVIPHPVYVLAPISSLLFAAAAGTHGTIQIFRYSNNDSTFELFQTLEGHRKDKQIRFLHSDPSSESRLVSAGDDKTIRIWDVLTGQQVRKVQLANPIYCGVFLGTFELIIGDGKDIRVFDTRNWGYQKLSAHASSVKHLEKINSMSFISSDESGYALRFSLLSSRKQHNYLAECTLGSECASDGIVIETNRVCESNHGEYRIYDSKERAMFQESQDELSFQQAQSEEEEEQQQQQQINNNHKDNNTTTTTASSSKNNITQNNNNINNNTQDTAIVVSSSSFSQNITDTLIAHPYREALQVGITASITSSNIIISNKNHTSSQNNIISPDQTTPQARNSKLSQNNTNHMLAQLSSPCRSSSTYLNTPLQLTALQTPVLRTPFKTPAKMNQNQGQSSSSGENNRFKSFSSSKYQPSAISNQHLNSNNNNENAYIFDCSNNTNNAGVVKLKGTKNTLQSGVYPFEGQFQHQKACVRCNSSQGQVSALVASLSKEKREAVSQVAEMKEEIQRLKHLNDLNFQLNSENALLRSQQAQHLATITQLSAALHRLTAITNKENNNKSKDINNTEGAYQEQQLFEETQQLNTECMQFSREQPTHLRTEQLQFSDTENGEKDGSISEIHAFDTDQTLGSYHPNTGGSFMQQQQQQQQQQSQVQLQIDQFHRNQFTRTQGKQQQQQQWQNEYSSYIKTDLPAEWDQIKKSCDENYESNDENYNYKGNLHSNNTTHTVLNLSIDKLLTKFLSQQELESARNSIPSKLPAHTVESSFPFSSDYQNPDHLDNNHSESISSLLFSASSACNTNGEQVPILSSRQKYRKIQIMAELRNAQDDLLNTKAKIESLKQQHENNNNSSNTDSNHISATSLTSNSNELSSARANMEAQYAQKLAGLAATLKHQKKEVDSWMKIYNDIYAKLHETEILLSEPGAIAMGVS